MDAQNETCGRCGQKLPPPSNSEEPPFHEVKEDSTLCCGCGQPRPYPTRPGLWKYRSTSEGQWLLVEIESLNGKLYVLYGSERVPLEKFGEDYNQWKQEPV
jgi:hypothetical protein